MQVQKPIRFLAALAVLAATPVVSLGQIFTDDDFLASGYNTSSESLADIRFNVDYSSLAIFPSDPGFVALTIPEAPNSDPGDTATTGVFLSANNDSLAPGAGSDAFAAIMPDGLNIGNGTANEDFKMSIDVFHSTGTGLDGGPLGGTTNYAMVGIHQDNTTVQVENMNAPVSGNLTGQGLRLAVTADSGAAEDYVPMYGGAFYATRVGGFGVIPGQTYTGDPNAAGGAGTEYNPDIGLVTDKVNQYWLANGFEVVDTDSDTTNDLLVATGDSLFRAPDPSDVAGWDAANPATGTSYTATTFPKTTGPVTHYTTTAGTPNDNDAVDGDGLPLIDAGINSNRWSTHELYWVDDVFTYVIDGNPVLQIDPEHDPVGTNENVFDPFSESGSVILSFWDRFSSIADSPEGANFVIYDNLIIETATAGDVPDVQAVVDSLTIGSLAGDFDGDGDVDVADALKGQRDGEDIGTGSDFQTNFGTGSAVSAVASVPEPTSAVLALVALAGLGVRRRS